MGKNLIIVQLQVYKGQKMSYDENGVADNENQPVKIPHGTFQWKHFLNQLKVNGYCKVEVKSVVEVSVNDGKESLKAVDNIEKYKKEVEDAFSPKVVVELTEDQKRIAELEKKLEALAGGSSKQEKTNDKKVDEDLESARAEYEKVFGKKPHHMVKVEKLNELIKSELEKK